MMSGIEVFLEVTADLLDEICEGYTTPMPAALEMIDLFYAGGRVRVTHVGVPTIG